MADSLIDWVNGIQSVAENQTDPVASGEIGRNPQLVRAFPHPPPYQNGPPASADAPSVAQGTAAILTGTVALPQSPKPLPLPNPVAKLGDYRDVMYDRVHVIPSSFQLGNVLQNTSLDVEVWNAYPISKTLSQVSGGQTGVDVLQPTPPGLAPADFRPRASFLYTAQVLEEGPNTIDALFTFDFSTDTPTLLIQGTRSVLLPFPAQRPITEALEWSTDIISSYSGREQRIRNRILPRTLYEMQIIEDRPIARTSLLNRVYGFHGRSFAIPLWHFGRPLLADAAAGSTSVQVNTENADFREQSDDTAGQVLLWRDWDDFEVIQVAENGVSSGSLSLVRPLDQDHDAVETEVLPLLIMLGDDPLEWSRTPNGVVTFSGSWTTNEVVDQAAPDVELTMFDGSPVLDGLNFTTELSESFEAGYNLIDFKTGPFQAVMHRTIGELNTQKGFETDDDAEAWEMRRLLYALRGRQRSFWLPSWQEDFEVVETIQSAAGGINVTNAGHARFLDGQSPFSAIMLRLVDGTHLYRKVTGITDNGDGTETVAIDSAPGQDIDPGDVDRMSYLIRSRLGSDRIEIEFDQKGVARVNATVVGVIE